MEVKYVIRSVSSNLRTDKTDIKMDKNYTWNSRETLSLIQVRTEFEAQFHLKTVDFNQTWVFIQKKAKLDHIPLIKVKTKWKNLLKKYRTLSEVDKNVEDSDAVWKDAYDWIYYDSMHKFFESKNSILGSSNVSSGNTSPTDDPLVYVVEQLSDADKSLSDFDSEFQKVFDEQEIPKNGTEDVLSPKPCKSILRISDSVDSSHENNRSILKIDGCSQKRRKFHNESKITLPVKQSNENSKEFQIFGESVAIQLSKLPLEIAIQLQADFQNELTRARLNCLKPNL